MDLEKKIKDYLVASLKDASPIDEKIIEEFGERCKEALRRQFNSEKKEFKIRMSSVGKPLCQQQLEKEQAKAEELPASVKLKFIFGDMVEALVMAVMEASGINIESYQEEVSYDLGKVNIKGTLDVVIDGKVYDIKSTSKHAFTYKFSNPNGFANLVKDDPFGYVSQGYLYGAAKGIPFGGWIAFNKETGDIAVLKTPENSGAYERKALHTAKVNAKALADDAPFERCFKKEAELVRRKLTGNYTLGVNCRYCKFKQSCWGKELVFRKNPRGATSRWYFGEPK